MDWWRGFPDPTPSQVANALLLTDALPPDDAVIASWSPRQRYDAWRWAWLTHLYAGNNGDAERMPEPPHVKALPRYDWRNHA